MGSPEAKLEGSTERTGVGYLAGFCREKNGGDKKENKILSRAGQGREQAKGGSVTVRGLCL